MEKRSAIAAAVGQCLCSCGRIAGTLMDAGRLIVITGPSGVGKGTLVRALLKRHPELQLSISATTREPRPGEIDGIDYHFLSREEFETAIAAGEFLEWAEYAGNYYGTPRVAVEEMLVAGKWIVLEIEVVGARSIQKSFPDALRVFVVPPSMEELERRLRARGKDSEDAIQRRLEHAEAEIAAKDEFDWQLLNDDVRQTIVQLEEIVFDNAGFSA